MADERRRYFRVSDLVGLRYRILSEGERQLVSQEQPSSLKGLLGQIEGQIDVALLSLKVSNPEITHLLDLYNQKINLAFGHGLADQEHDPEQSVRASRVSLSACGIAFPCKELVPLNQHLLLDLTLYPNNIRLQLSAAVIACDEYEEEGSEETHVVRANFVNVADADQEQLVQHVIKRQAQQLNEERSQHSDPE